MSLVNFLIGKEENLPNILLSENFYITSDTGKILNNNFIWNSISLNEDDINTNNIESKPISGVILNNIINNKLNLLHNNAGQIKVNYTGLTVTGFTSNVEKIFPLHEANYTISPYPTTIFPKYSPNDYSAIYIPGNNPPDTMRLRENNIYGQTNRWRIIGNYNNKTIGNTISLQIILKNPDSGFNAIGKNYLPSTVQEGSFAFEITTISDEQSISDGKGYIISIKSSSDDINLSTTITSILRISEATELTF